MRVSAEARLDRHLRANSPRPLAVAVSGGGDSVALLLIARDWAERHRRPLVVLTVDHRLNPDSAPWTERCRIRAARLGAGFQALAWEGDKPGHGLAAAARAARHRLLADAARAAGATVLMMGHTADDVAEAEAMRRAGATTPSPRAWAPAPVWPQGRDLFILRPLLDVRRRAIRQWLDAAGETWIDDPANADPKSLRARVRRDGVAVTDPILEVPAATAARLVTADDAGVLSLPREALRADPGTVLPLISRLVVFAGGGDRRPDGAALLRLATRLASGEPMTANLAGARVQADAFTVRVLREAGETRRGGLAAVALSSEPVVWDGRFEVSAPGVVEVRALKGLFAALPEAQRRALSRYPAAIRPTLPALVHRSGAIECPLLAKLDGVGIRSLVFDRFAAAAGLIDREPA